MMVAQGSGLPLAGLGQLTPQRLTFLGPIPAGRLIRFYRRDRDSKTQRKGETERGGEKKKRMGDREHAPLISERDSTLSHKEEEAVGSHHRIRS